MKIAFTDFWFKFVPEDNFFVDIFRDMYGDVQVTHPSNADILIYSCYGRQHTAHSPNSKIKIFYTGENERPNYNECTYSLSFDFDDYGGRNLRLPLWFLQFDWYNKGGYVNPEFVMPLSEIDDNKYIRTPSSEFCVLVNNNLFDNRMECIKMLAKYKSVTCFGKPFGNWFYGESTKYEIFSKFKFSICFENGTAPCGGYYTEKLIHAKLAGTLPLYYADEQVAKDFNTESFLNLNDYKSMEDFVNHVIEIDKDDKEYQRILSEPLFHKNPTVDDLEKLKVNIKNMIGLR